MRVTIVGGGISGLAAAHGLVARGHDVVLLDAGAAPGGLIASDRRDGFLCEHGPQAVLDGPEETRALIDAAGLTARVQHATPAARRRFVYVGGALRPFPASPPALFKTNLLSSRGKLRLFAEPFVGRAASGPTNRCSPSSTRRFGREAAERAAAPALIGVFAGDAAALSMRSALPRVAAMEREHGSILRALGRRKRAAAGSVTRCRFPSGLAELPAALARALGARRRAGARRGDRADGGRLARGDRDRRDHRQRAAGARDAGGDDRDAAVAARARRGRRAARDPPRARRRRLRRFSTAAGADHRRRPRRLRLRRRARRRRPPARLPVRNFGVPRSRARGRRAAARAAGRNVRSRLVDADDGAIAAQAVGDLRRVAGLARDPDFVDVWRARPGIPQYDLAHADRVRAVDDAVARLPGLAVIGNALRGVGVNDCIAAAARLASA